MSFWSPHIAAIVQIRRNAKDGIFVRATVPYLVVKGVPLSGVSATSRSLSYSARPPRLLLPLIGQWRQQLKNVTAAKCVAS